MGQNELASSHPTGGSKIDTTPKTLSLEHKDALLVLGYVFFQHHQRDRALVLFEALNVLFPKDTHISLSLAYAYLLNGHYARALKLAELCDRDIKTTIDGKTSPGMFIKIRALWALDRQEEARQQFQIYINGPRFL